VLVAGVDSSTQSCKVVIRDAVGGTVVRTGRARHPEGTEVDPEAWWTALLEAIRDAGGLEDVTAVSIGGQQHGMVALDGAGQVVRPALLWNDTRSAGAALDLIAEFGADDLARRSGSVPVASYTITKLRWLRDAEPDNAARVAAVALPHDWLTWRLLGYGPNEVAPSGPTLEALATDRSDASGTGYYSSVTGRYDRELLIAALGHDAVLPRVLQPSDVAGKTVAGIEGIPAGILVGAGAGDNAGAALGLGAREGDVVVSIGTSGTVFAVTDTATSDAAGTVSGFASASGEYLPLIATLNAARILDATARLLDVDHDELGRLALEAPPGADGLVLVPYFEGERTPNLPDATATLSGMTLATTTRPHLARAAVEGMLCALADGLAAVQGQGVVAERLLLVGGAAQNPAVATIAAQVFGEKIVVPAPGEYVAAGAAVQAAWAATGSRPDWPIDVVAEPESDHRPVILAAYRAAASRWS
jgi:xylulokinase